MERKREKECEKYQHYKQLKELGGGDNQKKQMERKRGKGMGQEWENHKHLKQ